MPIQCPACGSKEYSTKATEKGIPIPYGPDAKFFELIYTCSKCKESGDFTGENDKVIEAELASAYATSTKKIINDLAAIGITVAYIERVLRLSFGSIKRGAAIGFDSAQVALLQILRTYPWILEVAEQKFNSEVAKTALIKEANKIGKT